MESLGEDGVLVEQEILLDTSECSRRSASYINVGQCVLNETSFLIMY